MAVIPKWKSNYLILHHKMASIGKLSGRVDMSPEDVLTWLDENELYLVSTKKDKIKLKKKLGVS